MKLFTKPIRLSHSKSNTYIGDRVTGLALIAEIEPRNRSKSGSFFEISQRRDRRKRTGRAALHFCHGLSEAKGELGMKPGLVRFTGRLDAVGDTRLRFEKSFNQRKRRHITEYVSNTSRPRLGVDGSFAA